MLRKLPLAHATLALCLTCMVSGTPWADTVKGRIAQVSEKSRTLQIKVEDHQEVVRIGPGAQFVNAKDIKDLGPDDLVEVELQPGQPATRVTKVVFELPPEQAMDLVQVAALVEKPDAPAHVLVDARPTERYEQGHIPTAISIPTKDLADRLRDLPKDKLIVFYCGGPTCPFTRESLRIMTENGYDKVKGFNGGLPGWRKAKKPVHVSADYLARNLDPSKVIIDVRPKDEASRSHIKTAVSMPAARFDELRQGFIREKKPARLPGVADKLAPIVLYADTPNDPAALKVYQELLTWGYKNVGILEGGVRQWTAQGKPTETGSAAEAIVYVKKLKPGGLSREEFSRLAKERPAGVTFLDVRQDAETKAGMLPGAVHINLDSLPASLAKLPKDGEIVSYCANGVRAEMAYRVLKKAGYQKARFLDEVIEFKPDGSFSYE